MKRSSRCGASGCTCTAPWMDRATPWSFSSVEHVASRRQRPSFRKALKHHQEPHSITLDGHQPSHSALAAYGNERGVQLPGPESDDDSLLPVSEQRCGAGPPSGEGALAPDVGVQNLLECAPRHYRHRTGAEDSQTPVRNSDPMAVESRGDLASRHGRIGRLSGAHSWSYRSDNPICTRTCVSSLPTSVLIELG